MWRATQKAGRASILHDETNFKEAHVYLYPKSCCQGDWPNLSNTLYWLWCERSWGWWFHKVELEVRLLNVANERIDSSGVSLGLVRHADSQTSSLSSCMRWLSHFASMAKSLCHTPTKEVRESACLTSPSTRSPSCTIQDWRFFLFLFLYQCAMFLGTSFA